MENVGAVSDWTAGIEELGLTEEVVRTLVALEAAATDGSELDEDSETGAALLSKLAELDPAVLSIPEVSPVNVDTVLPSEDGVPASLLAGV